MTKYDILRKVDHTNLKPTAATDDILQLCIEATKCNTASVCIQPFFVALAKQEFPNLTVGTVIGFPNGYNTSETKRHEAWEAIKDGADELDMVININAALAKDYEYVEQEIRTINNLCKQRDLLKQRVLKVIVEAGYFQDEELICLCAAVTNAGADYIKTSTGFGPSGATIKDVQLFRQHIGKNVKIKAAGGVNTFEDAELFIKFGATRIGSSRLVGLLQQT